jgi:hypothetical protein
MSMQMAELHYTCTPSYEATAIAERAEALIHSGIELPDQGNQSDTLLFFHTNHAAQYADGSAPASTAILPTDKPTDPEKYTETIQQSWHCEDALERLQACTTTRLVSELMARSLRPADRVMLFHGVLQALVEISEPHAIVFTHSQQIIAPEHYLASCMDAPIQRPGALNVRFYRITNSETDDMIMDTRGLDEIGLHDLQCHFRQLDPNDVSSVLYNTGLYIFESGPCIESGHTIPGPEPDSTWQCQFENSLLDPKRELLDLDPGPPFSAGQR